MFFINQPILSLMLLWYCYLLEQYTLRPAYRCHIGKDNYQGIKNICTKHWFWFIKESVTEVIKICCRNWHKPNYLHLMQLTSCCLFCWKKTLLIKYYILANLCFFKFHFIRRKLVKSCVSNVPPISYRNKNVIRQIWAFKFGENAWGKLIENKLNHLDDNSLKLPGITLRLKLLSSYPNL